MSDFLSREELLRPSQPRTIVVAIPELQGKKVRVRAMNAGERGRFQRRFLNPETGEQDPDKLEQSYEMLCAEIVVDESGNRLLTPDDVEALKKVDAVIVVRIAEAGMKLSRLGKYESKDLAGNSATTNGSASPSSSPSTADAATG